MTLIIAKINATNNFEIYSDTRVTDDVKQEKSKIFEGLVKSIIYSPNININFAGTNSAVEEIQKNLNSIDFKLDTKTLIQWLFRFHKSKSMEIEFLIASVESKAYGLYKISQGEIDISKKSSWIGDIDAFEIFQEELHKIKKDKPLDDILDISKLAFENVILNLEAKSVGGVPIIVYRTDNGFQYKEGAISILGKDVELNFQNGAGIILDFGSAPEGSYNYCYLVSANPENQVIAIHYYDGNVGIFSYPYKSRKFQLYPNCTAQEFVFLVKVEHDIYLTGIIAERGTMRRV